MVNKFFEVFFALDTGELNTEVLKDAVVECITISDDGRRVTVDIKSSSIIDPEVISKAEEAMERQLFGGMEVETVIHDRYELLKTDPRGVFSLYEKNLEAELSKRSIVLRDLYESADKRFDGDVLVLGLQERSVTAPMASELKELIPEITEDRLGMRINVRTDTAATADGTGGEEKSVRELIDDEMNKELNRIIDEYNAAKEAPKKPEKETEKFAFKKKAPKKVYPNAGDIIYGRSFDDSVIMPISDLTEGIGEVVIRGKVIDTDVKDIKNERSVVTFAVTDNEDTITSKLFVATEDVPAVLNELGNAARGKGALLCISGTAEWDTYSGELTIGRVKGIAKLKEKNTLRPDDAREKRVELHAHTKKSDMDAVVSAEDLIKRAIDWGHPAVAITDHGVVQAFTDALKFLKDMDKAQKALPEEEKKSIKVIYGLEAYLVDDIKPIVLDGGGQDINSDYVVFDLETTGLSHVRDRIIEIGAVKVSGGKVTDTFSTFVDPGMPISKSITDLTHITNEMVAECGGIEEILPAFLEFSRGCVLVAHNASFDTGFIKENCIRTGLEYGFTAIDTVSMARTFIPDLKNYKLDTVCSHLNISLEHHHRAMDDAAATAQVFIALLKMALGSGVKDLAELSAMSKMSANAVKRSRPYHCVILAASETGRVNLYRLVSASHLDYFYRYPKIPKTLLSQYREGLVIGSACEAGEVYQAVLDDVSDAELKRIADFYDYLEIMPVGNNAFMIGSEKHPDITGPEDLRNINRKIAALGEALQKPVCATGDVHYLEKEDEIYRRILKHSRDMDDDGSEPSLYFRTTGEMLEEFSYLGEEKAYEVVVKNPNLIAGRIEKISPVSPDKCPPVIENSDRLLKEICYEKAHELYGEVLPELVAKRLEKELNSIISNGFAVMYMIARKLVMKSLSDGYLVGSRGSVGSSFVAYLSGITEVNSLHAHYRCPECRYSDFDSDYVKGFAGRSGYDMEDRECPVCGAKLLKDGHDIPFETFLGFEGDKEPDIDLNFSGEYQPKAHSYTEVIFGHQQTFRAGTIGGVAEKTAFGYVKGYLEDKGITKRNCEIARLAKGLEDVKRTTGQHPGGIVVLPLGMDINTFTPVQHPANDQKTKIVTTHFDYHSIDHNLLKLDILGHDDPTMIRMLQNLTGVDPRKIPFDDKKVLSLFKGTEALGITPDDIGGTELGSLGVPEFGTKFVIQMLLDTKPDAFSSLVRISGLSHGTDVWNNNAQDLVRSNTATISTCICTRDDIMIYLIGMGMEPAMAFQIMENVRKGKGLTREWEQAMKEDGVPDWYIGSCQKIKYMFPKAHAVAYVMMSLRIAWFKVYEPLAYYAAYFSIRADTFSYEKMCRGRNVLEGYMREAEPGSDGNTKKDDEQYKIMKIVQEFLARGFEFLPIDLYESDATRFLIKGNKLLPPFSSLEGMGDSAASTLQKAASEGEFLSKDEIRQRGKVSQTIIDKMSDLGIIKDMPESNQISLFDMGLI